MIVVRMCMKKHVRLNHTPFPLVKIELLCAAGMCFEDTQAIDTSSRQGTRMCWDARG